MANPILKSDLISPEAEGALDKLISTMQTLVDGFNQLSNAEMKNVTALGQQANAVNGTAEDYAKLARQIDAYEDAMQKQIKITDNLKEEIKKLREEKLKYGKASAEEKERVKALYEEYQDLIQKMRDGQNVTREMVKDIDVQKKSYNELYATYNALKASLNQMTTEQRTNTAAGKEMTAQALKIRDTLNELQKATGNYTLQVGKYKAAFDGLGFSFMQIAREAPSALNLNQFFLAISNNIPLFFDQVERFKKEQEEIKVQLKDLADAGKKATEEYTALAKQQTTVFARLSKAIFSFQGLVLVFTMLLRYLPNIVGWFKEMFKTVQDTVTEAMKLRAEMMRFWNDVDAKVSKTTQELRLLITELENVKKGSTEWMTIVGRINEITNGTLNATTATVDEVKRVTRAYMDQQLQIAKNAEILERLGRNSSNNRLMRIATNNHDIPISDRVRAITSDEEQQKELAELLEEFEGALKDYNEIKEKGVRDKVVKYTKKEINKLGEWVDREYTRVDYRPATEKEILSADQERMHWRVSAESYIKNVLGIYSQDIVDALEAEYKAVMQSSTTGPKGSKPSEKSVEDRYWEAEQALIEAMKVGYGQETALAKLQRDKERDAQIEWYTEQVLALEENAKNQMWSEERIAYERQELKRQNDAQMEKINREHLQRMDAINTKYAEMDRQVVIEEEKNKIEELDELYKVQENNRKRRIRTIKEEELSNLRIVESIQKMQDEIAALNALNLTQPEAIEQRTKRIEELGKAIEKMRQQIEYTKQLSNYSSIGDIFKRNGAFNVSGNMKTSILGSILGEDVVGKMSGDQIEGAFDTWLDNAGKSISTWYNTTMGYINDLIGAYVDLANAKAEAAKEATEAAQEEYEKEKALLEAGYASRVEATWAEYQEKKAAQEQAEKDAKAAAEAQQALNEVMTASNLIVASANLYKVLSALGPIGIGMATVAIGSMIAAFVAAKSKAYEVSKYGEGGFEVLEGGSHASGHDIDLGVNNRRGRRMHAEGKEGLGIFRVKAMQHYGADAIENVVNGINHLEYEQSVGRTLSLQRDMGLHNTMILPRTNLHRLESGVDKLVAIGSNSRHYEPDGTEVITTASGTTRIRRR